jgi:hypothetical protein
MACRIASAAVPGPVFHPSSHRHKRGSVVTPSTSGFAFYPKARGGVVSSRPADQPPKARISPDLLVGGLKPTGAGNHFQAFGEPDIEVRQTYDGMVTVEIRGLDVYHPATDPGSAASLIALSTGRTGYVLALRFA